MRIENVLAHDLLSKDVETQSNGDDLLDIDLSNFVTSAGVTDVKSLSFCPMWDLSKAKGDGGPPSLEDMESLREIIFSRKKEAR